MLLSFSLFSLLLYFRKRYLSLSVPLCLQAYIFYFHLQTNRSEAYWEVLFESPLPISFKKFSINSVQKVLVQFAASPRAVAPSIQGLRALGSGELRGSGDVVPWP